jgi:hypothetical protein
VPDPEQNIEPEREINSQAEWVMSFLSVQAHALPAALGCRSHTCCMFRKNKKPRERDINSQAQRGDVFPLYPRTCFSLCARLSIARLLPDPESTRNSESERSTAKRSGRCRSSLSKHMIPRCALLLIARLLPDPEKDKNRNSQAQGAMLPPLHTQSPKTSAFPAALGC